MTSTLTLRGVYAADGSALVVSGQPAVCLLQLTMPNPAGSGPDVPQLLAGRAFAQKVTRGDGSTALEAAGQALENGMVRFVLDADLLTALLAGGGAIDLTHRIVELVVEGEDPILIRPFAIRTPAAGAPTAQFTLNTEAADPPALIVRWEGAPGTPGSAGPFDDIVVPPLGAATMQDAVVALADRLNLGLVGAALGLQPTFAAGTHYALAGATSVELSEPVSSPGVFLLWRGGVPQAPGAYTVDPGGSATITVPAVDDDGSGGETFEWVHCGVDPLRVAAARAALGL